MTPSPFDWRGPSTIFTEQKKPREWKPRGSAFDGNGLSRRELDTQSMLDMHLAGKTWRQIGAAHGCCAGTAHKYTAADFPHKILKRWAT